MNQLDLGLIKRPKTPFIIKLTEHQLMNWCISYLTMRQHYVMRVNVTGGQKKHHSYTRKDGSINEYDSWIKGLPKGTPDIIGYHGKNGKFIGIEVKVHPNRPEPAQIMFIEHLVQSGGIGAIVYSQEELMAIKGL